MIDFSQTTTIVRSEINTCSIAAIPITNPNFLKPFVGSRSTKYHNIAYPSTNMHLLTLYGHVFARLHSNIVVTTNLPIPTPLPLTTARFSLCGEKFSHVFVRYYEIVRYYIYIYLCNGFSSYIFFLI